ncbi:MAG: hypothetical protein Q8Q09_11110 [Deltaproteobacteria bacterium]|nr:hypothetical protein [Deltaproteobacteria bacterium]
MQINVALSERRATIKHHGVSRCPTEARKLDVTISGDLRETLPSTRFIHELYTPLLARD